jgi:hypothetical protein
MNNLICVGGTEIKKFGDKSFNLIKDKWYPIRMQF